MIRAHQVRGENRNLNERSYVLLLPCFPQLLRTHWQFPGTRFSIPDLNDVQQLCDVLPCYIWS